MFYDTTLNRILFLESEDLSMKKNLKGMNHIVNILFGIALFLIGYDSKIVIITTICSFIIIILSIIMLFYQCKK